MSQLQLDKLRYQDELDRIAAAMDGPALQIGSREQVIDQQGVAGRKTWRERLEGRSFTGADLYPGDNVDAVCDITWPIDQIRAALPHPAYKTIICAHVLEHVRNPFDAAQNITDMLAPGGTAFLQVPWVQGFHAFPDDFWRISVNGLGVLFPELRARDTFTSGGSSDIAYRLTRNGLTAFDIDARQAEAQLFQVLLPQQANQQMLGQLNGPQYLSRGYMPAMVITWIARKPD